MKSPPAYSRDYLVHYYEIGRDRRLTLPALMHYFEDIATLNSEARGLTLDRYWSTGRLFLLLKWDIAVRSLPRFNETVRVETRPTAFKRFLANRDYAVFGPGGQAVAEARSVWMFTDMNTKKPARVPGEIYEAFGVLPGSEASFDPLEELPEMEAGSPAARILVGSSDLDNNDHVNNVRYVEWALGSLPEEISRGRAVTGLKVQYRKELRAGDPAELFLRTEERDGKLLAFQSIRSQGREICGLRMEWTG